MLKFKGVKDQQNVAFFPQNSSMVLVRCMQLEFVYGLFVVEHLKWEERTLGGNAKMTFERNVFGIYR
jgi:hypothetical protein